MWFVHIGHSTGGGEVICYAAKHGKGRVAKAIIISAVTPIMIKNDSNPEGVPMSIFDEIREGTGFNRAQYHYDFPVPFYGWNREGTKVTEGIKHNWWRQGMMGSVNAHYEGIKAFSELDFTKDLKSLEIPVLVMHGEDDQIVPYYQAPKAAKLLKNGKLISYPGFPHGMPITEAATINKDILAFIQS